MHFLFFYFHLPNCWWMHDFFFVCTIVGECMIFLSFAKLWYLPHMIFFICRILGHMHDFFITKNLLVVNTWFFFHLQNCWSMQDFFIFFIVELWYRTTRWQQKKGSFNVLE
jgi:hypothetical protein